MSHWLCPAKNGGITHCQAGLDRGITVFRLPTTLPGRCSAPDHGRIKPDRQRTTALQRFVIGGPVPDLLGVGCVFGHVLQLLHWIHEMNPSQDLCNKAAAYM